MIVDENILRVCTSANAPILVRHHCSPLFFLDMHLSSRSAYFEEKNRFKELNSLTLTLTLIFKSPYFCNPME